MSVATGWRTNAVRDVQTVRRHGREYLRFPIIALREMVYDYPERGSKEFLPAEHIAETVGLWDGTPLAVTHPDNREQTVRDPEAFLTDVIGAVHEPRMVDGDKLRVDALLDVEKAEALGGHAERLVSDLRDGREVSVSAGYGVMEDEFQSGHFDGEQYDLVQGPPLPDHIAIFPSDLGMQARCSPEDGCAAPRANAQTTRANMSESASNGDSTVFPSSEEREKAIKTIQRESPGEPKPGIRNNDDKTILTIAQGFGYRLPNCNCSGTCKCNRTTPNKVNMAGVAGPMNRNYDDTGQRGEDTDEYPASGRRAWERRQVGLDDAPDDPEFGPRTRSEYEEVQAKRRANADVTEEPDTSQSAPGTRANYEHRKANADESEEKEWLTEEYPLTAKRRENE